MTIKKIFSVLGRIAAAPVKGSDGLNRSHKIWGAFGSAATAAVLLCATGAISPAAAEQGHRIGPGCDASRPAVSYYAGTFGREAISAGFLPSDAVPCAVVTGTTTETATVGINWRDGALAYAPHSTGISAAPTITTSKDDGATWQVKTPQLQSGTTSGIPWMNQDPETNRIWFAMIGPVPSTCPQSDKTLAQITWSDDEGKSWHSPPGDPADCRQLQGGMNVTEGPAPFGQPQPVGYPHVVYHCGNISDGAIPLSVHCYVSLNGGQSWSFAQGPNNPPSHCAGKYGGRGRAVGLDGTLYMSIECQPVVNGVAVTGDGPLYVASSRDEGKSWNYQFVTDTSYEVNEGMLVSSLAVDRSDNLYIAWVNAKNQPMLIVGNRFRWGSPVNVAQPGVNYVTRVAVAVNKAGELAVAYVGSTGGSQGTFNGYIAESKDALNWDPIFQGASVNDPKRPLMSSAYADSAVSASEGRIWVLSVAFGPDGTPWAGFHCGNMTNGTTTGVPLASLTCPDGSSPPPPPLALGVVGRLASAPGWR